MNDSKLNAIKVYYDIQTYKNTITIISAITDNGYEFYAELKGNNKYFKSRKTLYNNWHKEECYSYVRYPQRHTDLYNGSITDITKYKHVNQIHVVADYEIVMPTFIYWLSCIDKDMSNIVFISDLTDKEFPFIDITDLLITDKIINNINLYFCLRKLNILTNETRIQYTNGIVEGIENHGFYNVKMVKELYHRLVQQSRIKEDGTLLV